MVKIKIISVGSKSDKNIAALIDGYIKKMSNQFNIKWVNIKVEKKFDSIGQKKEVEANKIKSLSYLRVLEKQISNKESLLNALNIEIVQQCADAMLNYWYVSQQNPVSLFRQSLTNQS